jgi:hypothetical protein
MEGNPSQARGLSSLLIAAAAFVGSARVTEATASRAAIEYAKVPLAFEANKGQTDPKVAFLSRAFGSELFLTPQELVVVVSHRPEAKRSPSGEVVRFRLIGASPRVRVTGIDELPAKSNYFLGNDPTRWRTNVPLYGRVAETDAYPGIDVAYYGNEGRLEHDFIVRPGGQPKAIEVGIEGARDVRLDRGGNLVIETLAGTLVERAPVIYQEAGGARVPVAGGYVKKGRRRFGFEVAAYDRTRPLVIDPTLVYSTYLGGSAFDRARGIAADASGNAYVTGETLSTDFPAAGSPYQGGCTPLPAVPGSCSQDVFVAKLGPASTLVYRTYLGGSSAEEGYAIAVDAAGRAYVTGNATSADFPHTVGSFGGSFDAFVAKLDANGSNLLYSTLLGGTGNDQGRAIAVDTLGNAYVAGQTSGSLPLVGTPAQPLHGGGAFDAFVAKLDTAGAPVYVTYLGGSGLDRGNAIAVDANGNAYVAGETDSTTLPPGTSPPSQGTNGGGVDAFVAKLNAASAFQYLTYLGGNGTDTAEALALDGTGNVYVAGRTTSPNLATLGPPVQLNLGGGSDAFIAKLDATSAHVYLTYLGGTGDDAAAGVAVDSVGNAYVTGQTQSPTTFPTSAPTQVGFGGGSSDGFLAQLAPSGSALPFSTFVGGTTSDEGRAVALDGLGNVYVAGSTAGGFPTAGPPFQGLFGGGSEDAFVAKIGGFGGGVFFHPVTPCRAIDTRAPSDGPALQGGTSRTFNLAGLCAVPPTARSASVNITITQSPVPGDLRLYPGGTSLPLVSAINYSPGQTRANSAIVTLGAGASLAVQSDQAPGTSVHFILDVNGFFE